MKKIFFVLFLFLEFTLIAQETIQSNEPLWWKMERENHFLEAASYLLHKVQSDSTRNSHADYWHIGRLYGYLNDYEKAIFYMTKSTEGINLAEDEQWWWYFKGTIAFLNRDKKELFQYMNKLQSNHTKYHESNSNTHNSLYKQFDKGYLEASKWK